METSTYELQISRLLDGQDILPAQRIVLKRYDLEGKMNSGLALKTRLSRAFIIVNLARKIKKPFMEMTKEDIENHIFGINLAPSTLDIHKINIRGFFKWLYKTEDYPENVKWIKLQNHKKRKLPEDILSCYEIKALIDAADNSRDRALVSVFYDSGCRLGEILNIKQRDITMDQYGARVTVHGKTGDRPVRLILSTPDLIRLLNEHPYKGPENPMFCNDRKGGKPLGARRVQELFDSLAKKAKLNKHVNPHLLRHSRATHLATDFTESELKVLFGWTRDSRMPGIYVSLSGGEVEKKMLEKAGLLTREEARAEVDVLKPRDCPRCKENNPSTARFCYRCGMALDLETAMKIENGESGMELELLDLMQREPRLIEMLKNITKVA